MKKILICSAFLFESFNLCGCTSANDYLFDINGIQDAGTNRAQIRVESKDDLEAGIVQEFDSYMIKDGTKKILDFNMSIVMNNFLYESNPLGIIANILDIATSKTKFSDIQKLFEKLKNMDVSSKESISYSDPDYIKFVTLFFEVFFKKDAVKLQEYDRIDADIKITYAKADGSCMKNFFSKLCFYISELSTNITSIKELIPNGSYIYGKFKLERSKDGKIIIKAIEE